MPPAREKLKSETTQEELARLTRELEELRAEFTRVNLEKNFLERAMEDLNFHNNAHDGVVYTDAENRVIYANPYFMEMMGLEDEREIMHKPFPAYMWQDQREAARLIEDIVNDGFVREREASLTNREGKPVFAMCSGVVSRDDKGQVLGTEIMFCNITGKRSVEADLMEQNALLKTMLESTPNPVLVANADLLVERSNPAAQRLFSPEGGLKDVALIQLFVELGMTDTASNELLGRLAGSEQISLELELGENHFEFHAAPFETAQGGWVCVLHDITQRIRTQEQLEYYAYHDMLTGLPNRASFISRLERIVARARHEERYRFAILFVDLDDLKRVNDNLGHLAGDELLREFARRLETCIRPEDMVCRLGGDEFAIFLDQINDEAAARKVAARIHKALAKPFLLLEEHEVLATASTGFAVSSGGESSIDQLLNEADKAMYRAKEVAR